MARSFVIRNIPNFLSGYRILALPFLAWSVWAHNDKLFIILLSVNLITDILDGLIARSFKLETEFGAKLDSIADIGTYIMAFAGMFVLHPEFVRNHRPEFILILTLYIIPQVVSLIKFKRSPSLHLYSNKITGYIQGIFIFTFFNFGYWAPYFYFMIAASCLAYLEELVCVLYLKRMRSNVKTVYHVVKQRKNAA
ncbi:MAG: CDP-alcohol phosphatidyltransferase [Crocinitomicaceae bacterium]|jgi:CDP-diacylglycerol--glycerol-3-phosphate 3-phosphatidyltransferase|nr:CDP-alcohol phosphatidyltransferase [Crocinitomicaceae bacterium]